MNLSTFHHQWEHNYSEVLKVWSNKKVHPGRMDLIKNREDFLF
ncbi:hypothetical protein A33Q_0603 [Indibacter alkaliphilus LW1]|uniref:Uncharacterized protein n=1 Tax=Indibacter alkaliphilus (strain CCUG 57479 / KCTC 22604 / LW1) TaxID=1189612 RepID=S2DPU9_INDAL|nr:hypothetical protein A33Q_0603 [Indibacter alkaliphilus LW1]